MKIKNITMVLISLLMISLMVSGSSGITNQTNNTSEPIPTQINENRSTDISVDSTYTWTLAYQQYASAYFTQTLDMSFYIEFDFSATNFIYPTIYLMDDYNYGEWTIGNLATVYTLSSGTTSSSGVVIPPPTVTHGTLLPFTTMMCFQIHQQLLP